MDTLYKRTSTGAIQYWKISLVTEQVGAATILKESGQLGTTSPVFSREHITEGKNIGKANETDAVQQAILQIKSDWTRKHDGGYKALSDFGITANENGGYICKVSPEVTVVSMQSLSELLESSLPKFNTDASGELLPMLAPSKAWIAGKKRKADYFPRLGEVKFDGNRATMKMTVDETVVLSRTGKVIHTMGHLIAVLETRFPRETRTKTVILDGELYLHGLCLEDIGSAIKDFNENTEKIQFWVYDLPLYEENQLVRSGKVQDVVKAINNPLFCNKPGRLLFTEAEILAFHDECTDLDFEGGMLKDPKGTYQPGQRSSFWEKLKMMEDNEYQVTGYELGIRGVENLTFICKCDAGEFKATMNGTLKVKEALYEKVDTLIGAQLTVQHFGFSKYGIPKLPKGKAFRYDLV